MSEMKGWVDTAVRRDNIWLVLVFPGGDGLGWEPKTGAELEEYFGHIKSLESRAWGATFQDMTRYMRERMRGRVTTVRRGRSIEVDLRHELSAGTYDLPLTLRTFVPPGWKTVEVKQGSRRAVVQPARDERGAYVLYQAVPNAGPVALAKLAGRP
jgi:hypothetical protein